MTLDALVGKYAWVNRIEGWTVAVMRRLPVGEVVRIYGGGRAEAAGGRTPSPGTSTAPGW
jgi:hypothetical protein